MKTQNTAIELTKEEVIAKISIENMYNIDIELVDGTFQTATMENLGLGVKFWMIK